MSKSRKFFGGFGRLILAMTQLVDIKDDISGAIMRTVRGWIQKRPVVRPDDWYAIERNRYAPWGRGRLGGRDLGKGNQMKPRSREYA